jgi:hypothetical protein
MCFFYSAEQASWEQTEPISTLRTMSFKKYSFPKLTQFSQGKNVLDAPASTSDGGLWTDTCVSSTQLNKPIWNKHSLSPLLKPHLAESILFKN